MGWRIALALIALLLLIAVVIIQRPVAVPAERKELAAAGIAEEYGPSVETTMVAKMYFGMRTIVGGDPQFARMMQESADSAADFATGARPAEVVGPPREKPDLPPPAHTRMQAAVLAAETLGEEAALDRLRRVEPVLADDSVLRGDAAILRRIYGGESGAEVSALMEDAERTAFLDRHGLFGELALSHGDAQADVRTRAARSGLIMVMGIMGFGAVVVLAGLAGIGMLIYFCVLASRGKLRPRFVEPARLAAADEGATAWGWGLDPQGRLIWLETVAVFLAAFLALGVSGDMIQARVGPKPWVMFYALLGQWLLVLTLFWPVVRGMPWQRWRGELGWHRGEGFFKEVGAGLMVYLASLPIYMVMAILVAITVIIGKELGWDLAPAPEDNKLVDLATSGNPLLIALLFLLATLWAPVVEESVFRGALYRHMRWRLAPVLAVFLTALAFAIMHGYAPIQLVMVGLLGVVFALIREWRGSLIGAMAAHFVHNAVVLTFVIVLFGQMGK